jgi:hypothetical protein
MQQGFFSASDKALTFPGWIAGPVLTDALQSLPFWSETTVIPPVCPVIYRTSIFPFQLIAIR